MDDQEIFGPDEDLNTEDPAVPTDLLELHVALEESNVTPDEFKETFG